MWLVEKILICDESVKYYMVQSPLEILIWKLPYYMLFTINLLLVYCYTCGSSVIQSNCTFSE
jgi:hypothetical protein